MDYRIKTDILELAMRQAIDSSVHAAAERFKDRLGDDRELYYRIATLAAQNAMEHFKAFCNIHLNMIQADFDRRMEHEMLRPPAMIFTKPGE